MITVSHSRHLGIPVWLQKSWALSLSAIPLLSSSPCLPGAFSTEHPLTTAAPAFLKGLPSMSGGRPGFSDSLGLAMLSRWPEL